VPLGGGHHQVQPAEVLHAVGLVELHLRRPEAGGAEADKGHAVLRQHLETGHARGVLRVPQQAQESVKVVDADSAEGPPFAQNGAGGPRSQRRLRGAQCARPAEQGRRQGNRSEGPHGLRLRRMR
jgi:hypothetical protein